MASAWLAFKERLTIPAIAAPMFLVSGPKLVTAVAKAGMAAAFPAPNARTIEDLDQWMGEISHDLAQADVPWALNIVAHRSYERLHAELELVVKHKPPLVILDEPMSGLDVHSQILVKEIVRQLALSGRAVLFSSHVMDVVERLCTRVAILKDGRVAAYGTFEELSASQAHGTLEGVFASVTGVRDAQARAAAVVEALAR